MSRFATPNRSRPVTISVAKSPKIPLQDEPGFKYTRGITLPGASIKGQHYVNDVRLEGMSTRSPTSPRRRRSNSNSRSLKDDGTVSSHSTMKKYDKPQRLDRKNKRKSPTHYRSQSNSPTANNRDSINRDNINVNSEVISVMSESISGRRSRSTTPNRNVSNSRAVNNPLWSTLQSSLSISDSGSVGGRSVSSRNSQTASISAISTSSLFHSLSQSTPPAHGIHNLQLSQKAFRSVRKTCVRDAIAQFLQAEDQNGPDEEENEGLAEEDDKQADQRRTEQKRHEKLVKMTDLLRMTLRDEIAQYEGVDYDQLFFPSENLHLATVYDTRQQTHTMLAHWRENYIGEALGALDRHFSAWRTAHEQRMEHARRYEELLAQRRERHAAKARRKDTLTQLRQQANQLGMNVQELLSRFPAHWLHPETQSPGDAVQSSIFLSPHHLDNSNNNNTPKHSMTISAEGLLDVMAELRFNQSLSDAQQQQHQQQQEEEVDTMLAHSSQYHSYNNHRNDQQNNNEYYYGDNHNQDNHNQGFYHGNGTAEEEEEEEVPFVSTSVYEDPNRLAVNFDAIRLLSSNTTAFETESVASPATTFATSSHSTTATDHNKQLRSKMMVK